MPRRFATRSTVMPGLRSIAPTTIRLSSRERGRPASYPGPRPCRIEPRSGALADNAEGGGSRPHAREPSAQKKHDKGWGRPRMRYYATSSSEALHQHARSPSARYDFCLYEHWRSGQPQGDFRTAGSPDRFTQTAGVTCSIEDRDQAFSCPREAGYGGGRRNA